MPSEAERRELVGRITDYLSNGGLFNPEDMEHIKVRNLLLDCRKLLLAAAPSPASLEEARNLAERWKANARKACPREYAMRNLTHKYLKQDNEAAGWDSCADELLAVLDKCTVSQVASLDEAVRVAVAQGWCVSPNTSKPMDCDLADAIVKNVIAALAKEGLLK